MSEGAYILNSVGSSYYQEALALINQVFRVSVGQEANMLESFPFMLKKENAQRMLCFIYKDEKLQSKRLVAVASYCILRIKSFSKEFDCAFIGSVCTDPQHEGKGLASSLIKEILRRLEQESHISICSVSGTRSLYLLQGFKRLPAFKQYRYLLDERAAQDFDERHLQFLSDLTLEIHQPSDLSHEEIEQLYKLYLNLDIRFVLNLESFKQALISSTVPWGAYRFGILLCKKDEEIQAFCLYKCCEADKLDYSNGVKADGGLKLRFAHLIEVMEFACKAELRIVDELLKYILVCENADCLAYNVAFAYHDHPSSRHLLPKSYDECEQLNQAGSIWLRQESIRKELGYSLELPWFEGIMYQ